MRRQEFLAEDQAQIEGLLAEVPHGYLAFTQNDGWPCVRPLNFVLHAGRVYFHGATEGEKMDALRHDPRVTFVAVREFSIIPSYFTHARNACPATQFYEAVMVRGRARIVDCPHEKAHALQALMEKLQPEGGHAPIRADDPLYAQSVEATGVVAIEIEHMTGKFKVGQNLQPKKRGRVVAGLEARGCPIDHATIAAMRTAAPDGA